MHVSTEERQQLRAESQEGVPLLSHCGSTPGAVALCSDTSHRQRQDSGLGGQMVCSHLASPMF